MKKFLLIISLIAVLVCVFALSVSADTVPDASKGTVTLSDNTVCALYDTNGNALIWYKSTANADDGYANYDFIRADSGNGEEGYEGGTVYFKTTWSGSSASNADFEETKNAVTLYEVSEVRIVDKKGNQISSSEIVIFNIKDDDVKSNDASSTSYLNKPVNCIKEVFNNNDNVEYIYFHPCLAALQANIIKGCDKLKYVNLTELVNLRQIDGGTTIENNPLLFLGGACDLSNTLVVNIGGSGAMANNRYSELILPRTLSSIGNYPFEKNPNLTKVVFNSELKSASNMNHFYNCTSLAIVEGFENVKLTSINQGFFENCPITSITIPSTVTSIGMQAFANTKLTEIVIPHSVTSLGQNAFKNCSELTTVTIGSGVKTLGGYDVFHTCPKLTTIYMPAGISGPDLRNIFLKSDAISTVYYIGTLDQLNTFKGLLSAVEGNTNFTSLTPISYDDYVKLTDKTGKYVIYDYSACDAYYNGAHVELDTVNGNDCFLAQCKNCSFKNKYIGNDSTHVLVTTYEYANGYMAEGKILSVCQHNGCAYGTKETAFASPLEALFYDLAYSSPEKGFGICVNYYINNKALDAYKAAGYSVSFGVVAIMADKVDGNGPLANDGSVTMQKDVVAVDVTNEKFSAVTLKITGEESIWKSIATKEIYVLGYATNGTDLEYLGCASENAVSKNNIASVKSLTIGKLFGFDTENE